MQTAAPETRGFSIQIVDDDREDRLLIRESLEAVGFPPERIGEHSSTSALFEYAAKEGGNHVVLHDFRLGAATVLDALPVLVRAGLGPVIVLTSQGDEESAAQCIQAGATDYLVKTHAISDPVALRKSIEASIKRFLDAQREKKARKELMEKNAHLAEVCEMSQVFVDSVSHEFRTPLAVLKEFNALLLEGIPGPVNQTQGDYLKIMATKIDDLAIMVNDLLDSSRIENGLLGVARRICSVENILDAVRTTLERRATVHKTRLTFRFDADLPDVYCDPEKVARIVINLVVNAMKFSPEGSTVAVKVEHSIRQDHAVRIAVTDQGPGIADNDIEDIFKRFRQVGSSRQATQGFGLGLSIVRDLIQLNLCDIDVESQLNQGSTFSVHIPTYEPAHLLRRYLNRIVLLGATSSRIATVAVELNWDNAEAREEAYLSILRSLRPSELMLPCAQQTRWVIVSAGRDGRPLMESLEKALAADFEGMPLQTRPTLNFSEVGTWDADRQRDALVARILELVGMNSEVLAYAEDDPADRRRGTFPDRAGGTLGGKQLRSALRK